MQLGVSFKSSVSLDTKLYVSGKQLEFAAIVELWRACCSFFNEISSQLSIKTSLWA